MEATDCSSRLCSVGLCLGYLAASTEEARETVAPALRAVAASAPPGAVEALLDGVLADRSSDSYVRGRAADAFRHLPAEAAVRVLPSFLADVDEPVRFFAARALAAAGDPRGREALAAWRDHPAEAVRILAARATGGPVPGDQGVNRK
jgi:HEAT repeat protein